MNIEKIHKYTIYTLLFLLSSISIFTNCYAKENENSLIKSNDNNTNNIFQAIFDSLKIKNTDTNFIKKYQNDTSLKFNERYIKINVTGYLKPTDYSFLYANKSIEQSKDFLKKHLSILTEAEKKYKVPKEIIVAILKIETRFGEVLGNNHLPSVFFSTALVNQQKYIDINCKVIDDLPDTLNNKNELKEKILQRSKRKSNWAINELIAISKIENKYGIDFNKINGSWAGAFGLPQFLPSSYLRSAVDGNNDGKIDLFDLEDAIFSVGNYLSKHKFDTFANKKKAVYSYNNSNDYAEAVIKLSEKLIEKKK